MLLVSGEGLLHACISSIERVKLSPGDIKTKAFDMITWQDDMKKLPDDNEGRCKCIFDIIHPS